MDENLIDPNSLPPRREHFTQPSAAAVWAAVCTLDPALQWEVLRELQKRLGAADMLPSSQNAQRAILALREAAELQGGSPSVRDYEELREQ